MAKLSLKNVTKNYPAAPGECAVLRGINLEIESRETVALTGPAGSGKTVLLRLIAGLETMSEGEILIGERSSSWLKPGEREVAMIFPDAALYPGMSVRENIAFGLKLRKFSQSEIARRVEDSAANLGIADFLQRRPAELPAAQQQRVSIARAIARQPRVLLLDEPLAHLDAATRAGLRAEMRMLFERLETTVIYATRDASEAIAIGHRMIVLNDGTVAQDGPPEEIYDRPANIFVAGFVGTPPMNLIRGMLKLEREVLLFSETDEGTIEARFPIAERRMAAKFVGKPVLLGVRPEDVEIAAAGKGREDAGFPALVDFVENTGATTTLFLQTGAHAVVSQNRRMLGEEPAGRRVRFGFDPAKVHFFDPASSLRIVET